MKKLLFIVEQGGVPVYAGDYAAAGFEVTVIQSMRKALSWLKTHRVDVICSELNVDPNFRDRVSNLEPLLAQLQRTNPDTNVIVFLDEEHAPNLAKLRERFRIFDALYYPLQMADIVDSLKRAVEG